MFIQVGFGKEQQEKITSTGKASAVNLATALWKEKRTKTIYTESWVVANGPASWSEPGKKKVRRSAREWVAKHGDRYLGVVQS